LVGSVSDKIYSKNRNKELLDMDARKPVTEIFGDVVMYTFAPWSSPNPQLPQEIISGDFLASMKPLELLLEYPDKRIFCNVDVDVFDDYGDLVNSYDGDRLRLSGHYAHTFELLRKCLFKMIANTPEILWILRTRHPQNIAASLPLFINTVSNICLGVTVSNQDESDVLLTSLLDNGSLTPLRMVEVTNMTSPIALRCNPYDMSLPSCVNKTVADHADCLSGQVPGIENYVLEKAKVDWVWMSGVVDHSSSKLLASQCSDSGVPALFRGWHLLDGKQVVDPFLSELHEFPLIDLRGNRIVK